LPPDGNEAAEGGPGGKPNAGCSGTWQPWLHVGQKVLVMAKKVKDRAGYRLIFRPFITLRNGKRLATTSAA